MSIQYRDNMYKVHKKANSNLIEFETQQINLKTYNAILKKDTWLAKKNYFETLFNKF